MRMRNGGEGQMRIIETILSSFVIIAALAFMNTMAINPPSLRYEAGDLEKLDIASCIIWMSRDFWFVTFTVVSGTTLRLL
jgi:hypothetical protein